MTVITKYRVNLTSGYEEFATEAEALAKHPNETSVPVEYTIGSPDPVPTWEDVDKLQNQLLSVNTNLMKRITRYKLQFDLTGKTPKEDSTKYQLLLQHCQNIRDADETNHATPDLAITALNALTEPTV